jgi:formate hydrogenlyase subunit 4
MTDLGSLASPLLGLLLAPALLGVVNKTKALFAGRLGLPLLQPYADLLKLLRKGAVYSTTTTWVFRAGPVVGLAVTVFVLALLPLGKLGAAASFPGDLLLVVGCLGLMRFFTILAALDTGSAFEGMGASREAQFSALVEPALLLSLGTLAHFAGTWSLGGLAAGSTVAAWLDHGASLALVMVGLFIVLLTENCRVPVDDPNTHLELTMIHEVMVLDHGGPDFAFIQYAAALKLWIVSSLVVDVGIPWRCATPWLDGGLALLGMAAVAVAVGVVESCMARLSLLKVPQLLVAASVFPLVGLLIE